MAPLLFGIIRWYFFFLSFFPFFLGMGAWRGVDIPYSQPPPPPPPQLFLLWLSVFSGDVHFWVTYLVNCGQMPLSSASTVSQLKAA